MTSSGAGVWQQVEEIYRSGGDPAIGELIHRTGVANDAELADLIQADGRARESRQLGITLERYLAAISDPDGSVEALDAAIDAALRSLTGRGRSAHQAVLELIGRHPALEAPIRESAALNQVVLSTEKLHQMLEHRPPRRRLPQDFGPALPDGRRRYQLTHAVGSGSAGEVYRATDRLLSEAGHDAVVAIKILAPLDRTPWARHRFLEEATKARRILDPNVVRVIDRGADETDAEYIVYEFVPGGDLEHAPAASDPARTPHEVVRIVAGIARGVLAAHAAGVVHCDLKPGNILLTETGEPKVADFGVAVRQHVSGPDPAADRREPIGNLAFIAPEQFRMEEGAHAPPADLYAIGGIMYWLATGVLPNGATRSEIERTHDPARGRTEPPSIRAIRPGFDRDLDAICRRCLAPDPQKRYHSAAQLVDDLAAWQRREPIHWTSPSFARLLSLWVRRKPAFAAFLVAMALAAVASVWLAVVGAELVGRERERAENAKKMQVAYRLLLVSTAGRDLWELLPVIPYLDWAYGTTVLGDPGLGAMPWEDRIAIIRMLYLHAGKTHGELDHETLTLETTLAFWLLCDGRAEEAASILAENRRRWARAMPGATRWLASLDAYAQCADIAILDARAGAGEPVAIDRTRLAAVAEQLTAMRKELTTGPMQRAQQRLIDRSLARVYGPRLLDRPELARLFNRKPPVPLMDRLLNWLRKTGTPRPPAT